MVTNKLFRSSKLIGVLLLSLCTLAANAQFLRTSYFMEDVHYRQQLNPAFIPEKGYINLPVIGSFNATVSSNSLGYQDVMDILDGGSEFYTGADFRSRLKDSTRMNVNFSTEILSAGWHKGKNFWTVNVGLRTDIGAVLTKQMFDCLNTMQGEHNWRNSSYDLDAQQLNLNAYAEIGGGFSRAIDSRLTVGGRVKVLLGIGNMDMKLNKLLVSANLPSAHEVNEWASEAYWQGTAEEVSAKVADLKSKFNGYRANLTVDAELTSSFKGLELEEKYGEGYVTDFKFDSGKNGVAGYGLGIDLGASYKILDNLTVSGSILDLGFISWSASSTKVASTHASVLQLKGSDYADRIVIDPNRPEESKQQAIHAINQLKDDAEEYREIVTKGDMMNYDLLQLSVDEGKSRTSRLASTIAVGAEYGFLDNRLTVGVLSTTRFVQPDTLTEITLSANYRPKSWLSVALSYSPVQAAGKSFGLGVKAGPLFVGTDYMFLGKNSKCVNGFMGVSIPL